MMFIEPREVVILVTGFEMKGIISGSLDSFYYESSNSHFYYYFPEGVIDSSQVDKAKLEGDRRKIYDACENKIKELLGDG